MIRYLITIACLGLALLAIPQAAPAQVASCTIVRVFDDGSMIIEVDGRRFRAFTPEQQERFLALEARAVRAERLAAVKDSLLTASQMLLAEYDSTLAQQRAYTATVDSLYRGYKDLAAGYRRLSGEAVLTFQAGLGMTGGDTEPALLAGLGLWRFRLWGFIQKENLGALAGVELRLF